ncbi:EamA family transporter RarD [Leeia sp. TBRC 13508]|uniref:EamA family transporter RarD n=1 Tax=Leeia speluncae TaxID=2884804 RepID=A0ABS8D9N6_9NEIS|nr:EamA family transporter RarD [Leeia speluncae]MCB6184921.1 EamA family transporter RarD [Leeia speluncae]
MKHDPHHTILKGMGLSVFSSVVFMLIAGCTLRLKPLDGMEIFAWRIIWTLPCVLLFIRLSGRWDALVQFIKQLIQQPKLFGIVLVDALLLGYQLWIFVWSPQAGKLVDVSMGYFLLPLIMVLVGKVLYKEHVGPGELFAVGLASLGCLHELWLTHAFSWVTLTVQAYIPYFIIRKKFKVDGIEAFAVELSLMLPVMIIYMLMNQHMWETFQHYHHLWLWLPIFGALSSIALVSYLVAVRLLPLGLVGMLGYVEPALLFMFAVFYLQEPFTSDSLGTYIPIWSAIVIMLVTNGYRYRNSFKSLISK